LSAINSNLKFFWLRAHIDHKIVHETDNLDLGLCSFNPKKIDIELKVLSQAAALRFFIPENIGNRVPAKREGEFALFCRNHSSDRRRHLWSQSNISITAIFKRIGLLIYNFIACF